MSVLKISTYMITSSAIGLAVILVIISVMAIKTAVILYICISFSKNIYTYTRQFINTLEIWKLIPIALIK